MSGTVNGANLIIPYDNQGDSVTIPFTSANSANYVNTTFISPIENYAPTQQSDFITNPSQIALGLPNPSAPTAIFADFGTPGLSTLDLSNQDAYAVVNASTVPVTINAADPSLQYVVNSNAGTTMSVTSATGEAAFAGGNNMVQTGTTGIESWYFDFEGGVNTVVAADGNNTITGSAQSNLMFLGSGDNIVYSEGTDTIVGTSVTGSGGAETVKAIGPALTFGNASSLTFIDGSTSNSSLPGGTGTVIGGAGALSVFGATGNVTAFGGTSTGEELVGGTGGNNALVAQSADDIVYGEGAGNIIVAGPNATADTLIGSASGTSYMFGNQNATGNIFGGPLNSSGATDWVIPVTGSNTIYGGNSNTDSSYIFTGAGNNTIYGNQGIDYVQAGSGANTIYDSSAYTLIGLVNGQSGGSVDVSGFNPTNAAFVLNGYASGTATTAIANATVANGSTSFTLPDHTQVTLVGYTGALTHASFV